MSLSFKPVVIVLAAGQGRRFRASGGLCHKLDAQLLGKAVRDHVMDSVRASGLPWHVVEPADQDDAALGMGDSIARGVGATRHADGWLILPADLPLVQPDSLRAVAQALTQAGIVVPSYQGQRGHPVGFSSMYAPELMALQGDRGANSIIGRLSSSSNRTGELMQLALDDEGCVADVDTVQMLEAAEQLLIQRKQLDAS